ncbi:50S ribosomal protein L3, apicoplast, putative [Plasmodium sp. gorilla clade G2]|uniref:50S ribosomal protein L3, apicoplast, putative n=1 Tax=Plasmodium sp. gorilla clade G2 TaxID=880535 RepID=UPI000D22B178|nr:50S ribosomal protein L3, apicoplast, putative [Plasmodium sp. gorilla clade G2]SOV14246.1 50S ribosomal protein L3, apicoplast, putative [Plasmodium sp. gorilla clade G2]
MPLFFLYSLLIYLTLFQCIRNYKLLSTLQLSNKALVGNYVGSNLSYTSWLGEKKNINNRRTFEINMIKKFINARDPCEPQDHLKDIPYKDELDRIQIRGKKIEMKSIFSPQGELIPATLIEIMPNVIYRFLDFGKVGIAYGKPLDESRWILKPEIGQIAKVGCNFKNTCSLTLTPPQNFVLGQIIDVSYLYNYKYVNVRGLSKGKGFSGVIKRWGFKRGPMTHGSGHHRKPGSIGASTHIGRVLKGKKMPGKHGNKYRTMINLKLLGLNLERNEILVSGCIPGNRNSYVTVTATRDNKVNKYKYILDMLYKQEKNVK